MPQTVTAKLVASHLVSGTPEPGRQIALRIDQTLTQDATGTLVMLELEALGLDRVRTEVSVQYVDHNLVQADHKNADDHVFLRSACRRFGLWYSPAGNGVSHPCHQECFGVPGKTLLGSDSHTPAAGALGMLAIGAGGLEVALAMAGEPYPTTMPKVWGVRLVGRLPAWVSAKDVILEMLRRHGVDGGVDCVFEYHGPGLAALSAMDRHVIANMGTELGATSTVFPSDGEVRRFLRAMGRQDDWTEILADVGARYDVDEEIDLGALEPLVALPSSPGDVVPVHQIAGQPIHQAYIGSSANPGYRDFAVAAHIVAGRRIHDRVSFDVNPTSRRMLAHLVRDGHLLALLDAGARVHQAGCNGCIGMGQAPPTGALSLRTVPRNFPGRSGTRGDRIALVSPETAAASALSGVVTDPRTLGPEPPRVHEPESWPDELRLFTRPLPADEAGKVELEKGPNVVSLPRLDPLPEHLEVRVVLRVGADVSTDEILPAGARVLPLRSNIPAIAAFAFEGVDAGYVARAMAHRDAGGHAIVAGSNYGQGSSREHAALAPRYLGLRLVLARSFARIHRRNLVNFGVLPLVLVDGDEHGRLPIGRVLRIERVASQLARGDEVVVQVDGERVIGARHGLSDRQREVLVAGGLLAWLRVRLTPA